MPNEGITLPAISGIARKKRSDAGTPRISSIDYICDKFVDLTPESQRALISVLEALHRQVTRGKIAVTKTESEDQTPDA